MKAKRPSARHLAKIVASQDAQGRELADQLAHLQRMFVEVAEALVKMRTHRDEVLQELLERTEAHEASATFLRAWEEDVIP